MNSRLLSSMNLLKAGFFIMIGCYMAKAAWNIAAALGYALIMRLG